MVPVVCVTCLCARQRHDKTTLTLPCCTYVSEQIIHRDIKPGNLLVTAEGNLKVADFGVSFMYDGEDDTVRSSAGTSAFLAPEVCSGKGASGKMVDVWATGVTLYMMLVGRVPFWAETVPEIYEKIMVSCSCCRPAATVNWLPTADLITLVWCSCSCCRL